MTTETWEPINKFIVSYVKPSQLKEGDSISGIYLETSKDEKYGTLKHSIQQEDRTIKIINGSGQLNHIMKTVKPGTKVKIEFAGKAELPSGKFKGTKANQWKVFFAKEMKEEVQSTPTTTT